MDYILSWIILSPGIFFSLNYPLLYYTLSWIFLLAVLPSFLEYLIFWITCSPGLSSVDYHFFWINFSLGSSSLLVYSLSWITLSSGVSSFLVYSLTWVVLFPRLLSFLDIQSPGLSSLLDYLLSFITLTFGLHFAGWPFLLDYTLVYTCSFIYLVWIILHADYTLSWIILPLDYHLFWITHSSALRFLLDTLSHGLHSILVYTSSWIILFPGLPYLLDHTFSWIQTLLN